MGASSSSNKLRRSAVGVLRGAAGAGSTERYGDESPPLQAPPFSCPDVLAKHASLPGAWSWELAVVSEQLPGPAVASTAAAVPLLLAASA